MAPAHPAPPTPARHRKQRRHLRDQAERLAQAAGKLALDLHTEVLALATRQIGWKPSPIAAALPLLGHARAFLATAVAADRAAGATWAEIAAVLDVSADTVARRYHT